MWILGDWGQAQAWNRSTGVKMTKGEDGVYSGVLTLPKSTPFDIKILKSSVSGTSGGNNVWSAVRYASVLNSDSAHDFGEFTDNLVPNGDFEEGDVKWTPAGKIHQNSAAHGGRYVAMVDSIGLSSSQFTIPPNQPLTYSCYILPWTFSKPTSVIVKDVDTHAILFETTVEAGTTGKWIPVSGAFKSGGSPVKAQVVCTAGDTLFDDIAIVSP